MAGISARWNTAWVWLAVALAIVGLVTAITAKHGASSQPMSTANPRPDGALAAYRWLDAIGYRSENLTALNLSQLPSDSSTIFFLQGQPELGAGASDQLAAWLRRGGIIVAAPGAGVSRLRARFGLSTSLSPPAPIRVVAPVLGRPPATRIDAASDVTVRATTGVPVLATRFGTVLQRIIVGKGVLWVLTAPQALDNRDIARADSSTLLVALAGRRGRTSAFAELPFHAAASGRATDWLTGLPWGIAALFATATFLAFRLTSGWRLGPPLKTVDESYRPATEFVLAMAGLLRHGRKREEALRVFQDHLRRSPSTRYPSRDRTTTNLLDTPAPTNDRELILRVQEIVAEESGSSMAGTASGRYDAGRDGRVLASSGQVEEASSGRDG
jgi:hypothetical protein